MTQTAVNEIINKIMLIKNKYITESANLTFEEINLILDNVQIILQKEPTLLELNPLITVVGDVHGQFHDLLRIFDHCGYPPKTNYLFLGDYIDRGFRSIETIILLFCFKILFPQNIFLIRGNHEFSGVNSRYGFRAEIRKQFLLKGSQIWVKFNDVFNFLPLAAIINDKIFCIHGGISPHLHSMDEIKNIQKPIGENFIFDDNHFIEGIVPDLMWGESDPNIKKWRVGDNGMSVCFGLDPVEEFVKKFKLKFICRGHQVAMEGIEYPFFPNKSFITVFSAPMFKFASKNKAAVIHIDEKLEYTVTTFEPKMPNFDPETAKKYEKILQNLK